MDFPFYINNYVKCKVRFLENGLKNAGHRNRVANIISGASIKEWLRAHKSTILDCTLLFALSFLSLWQMGISGYWNKTDIDYPVYPLQGFYRNLFLWKDFSLGHNTITTHEIQSFPIDLFLACLQFLGLPSGLVQRIFLVLLFASLGWSTYYMMSNIVSYSSARSRRIACLTASVFAMFNAQIIFRLNYGTLPYIVAMVLLPFSFTFFHKGLKQAATNSFSKTGKYLFLFSLSSVLLFTNQPGLTVLIALFFLSYIAFHLLNVVLFMHNLANKLQVVAKSLGFFGMALLLSLLLNLWWILPQLFRFEQILFIALEPDISIRHYSTWAAMFKIGTIYTSPIHIIDLKYFLDPPESAPRYWNIWINGILPNIVSILLLTLVSFGLFQSLKRRKKRILESVPLTFVVFVTIFALAFVLADHTIFGRIYYWLLENVLIFRILAKPDKFFQLVVFGYTVMIGIGSCAVFNFFKHRLAHTRDSLVKRNLQKILTLVFFSLILVNSFPLLTGNLSGLTSPIQIPSYYIEADRWLVEQTGDFRLMVMPREMWMKRYTWASSYGMIAVEKNVFSKSVINERVGGGPEPTQSILMKRSIYDAIANNASRNIGNLLNLLNIKYIVVMDDLMLRAGVDSFGQLRYEKPDTSELKQLLNSQKDLQLAASFGSLHFYLNKEWSNQSKFYATTRNIIAPSAYGDQVFLLEAESNMTDSATFFENQLEEYNAPSCLWTIQVSYDPNYNLTAEDGDFVTLNKNGSIEIVSPGMLPIMWPNQPYNIEVALAKGTVSNFEASVNVRALNASPSCQAELRARYQDEGNHLALKLSDSDGDGKWDQFKLLQISDNKYVAGGDWSPIGKNSSVATLVLRCFDTLCDGFVDAGADGVVDADVSLTADDVVSGDFALTTYRAQVSWEDIKIGQQKISPINEQSSERTGSVNISCEKIDPTKYVINADAETDFTLVFLESYDLGWEAKVGEETLVHKMANGYANAWFVNKGQHRIIVEFRPQTYRWIGFAVSLPMSILLILGTLLRAKHKPAMLSRSGPR